MHITHRGGMFQQNRTIKTNDKPWRNEDTLENSAGKQGKLVQY